MFKISVGTVTHLYGPGRPPTEHELLKLDELWRPCSLAAGYLVLSELEAKP